MKTNVKKQPKVKEYVSLVTKRYGSNTDGSAKINVTIDDKLTLTATEAKNYRRLKIIK